MADRIKILTDLKEALVKLSTKKTRLETENGIVFEFSGELTEGTELDFSDDLEEDVSELTLSDGRIVKFEDNKVVEIVDESSEEEFNEDSEDSEDSSEEEFDEDKDDKEDKEDKEMDEDEEDDEELDEEEHIIQRVQAVEDRLNNIDEQLEAVVDMIVELTSTSEEMFTKIKKISKEPIKEKEKKEIKNDFNKTKSRAAKIMQS